MASKLKSALAALDLLMLLLNIFAATGLALSYLAQWISPRVAMLIAYLGFAYFFLALINLAFMVYWLLRRKWKLAIISGICISVGITNLVKFVGIHRQTTAKQVNSNDAIRVIDYNVHEFKTANGEKRSTSADIQQLLSQYQADIITLQEFKTIDGDRLDQVTKNLSYPFYVQAIDKTWVEYSFKHTLGNVIFSRFPIVNSGRVDAPPAYHLQAAFADISYKGSVIRVYCVHLAPITIDPADKRRYLDGKEPMPYRKGIWSKVKLAFELRSHQADYLRQHIAKCPYPVIVAGDFNDTPMSYAVNTVSENLQSAALKKGNGLLITYQSALPLQIDYIFASKTFNILNYQIKPVNLSDHYPVMCDLSIK